MKILMVTPMPPQSQAPGAIPLVLHAELTGLMQHHQISLVTVAGLEPGEQEAVNRLASVGLDVRAVRRTQPQGWQRWQRRWSLASYWLSGKVPWRTVWFWESEVQHILDSLLAEKTFDLIIVEDNAMGVYSYRTNTPLLFTEHEVRRPRPIDKAGLRQSNLLLWILKEADWARWLHYQRSVWRKFDRVQAFTQRDAEAISTLAPEMAGRVRVNPFGIEIPSPTDVEAQEQDTILFTGNFTHAPNVDAALWLGQEIMPLLRENCPGIRLWLIGIYPPPEVRALACSDIQVTGPVPEIEPYFSRAALVVAPVRIGGGMRMKVLQAMALGKAVVTTSRGADGLATDGRRPPLVTADDTFGFAQAILRLLSDDSSRRELGRQARLYVAANFSAQSYANRIETIYAEMQGARS
ncbi:MAG: glycosyl transferase group 1 [Chloroflexi bacterium]|nr:glycosyl transferase group 1 [Chloroflexota bacterium]